MPKLINAPKHRGATVKPARKRVRTAVVMSGVAVAATGIAVSTGVLAESGPANGSAVAMTVSGQTPRLTQSQLNARVQSSSRSADDRIAEAANLKKQALSNASGSAHTSSVDLSSESPQDITKALMPSFGMSPSDFDCVNNIWTNESGWNVHAANPASSAYGIPQALPGSKMASAGPDWQNNPETQIKWGLGYIKSRYGSPCSAWAYKQAHGWY